MVSPGACFAERERQSSQSTERREKQREKNGKLQETQSNKVGFKGSRFRLKRNKHMKGARTLQG